MLMHGPDEKVRVVFLDHLSFKTLAKLGFPSVAVFLLPPIPVGLPHLPIGTDQRVPATINIAAAKLISKIEGYFFEGFVPAPFQTACLATGLTTGRQSNSGQRVRLAAV